jgi:short-subunit dehydrogenase
LNNVATGIIGERTAGGYAGQGSVVVKIGRSTRGVNIEGKRVLLTGASSGIGRALAVRLAKEGAVLLLAARRTELLDHVADEIRATGRPRPLVARTDLSQPGAARALGEHALQVFGGSVDILINNAGGSLTGSQSLFADSDQARLVFEVNVWSPLALTATVLPAMHSSGSGTIVNVTSTMQAVPLPLLGYYGASKAALAQSTHSLRLELAGTPIRVLEVVPGSTDTALRDIDELPWKTRAPRTLPPASPGATAAAVARALRGRGTRVVYPTYSLAPLEIPAIGRLVARIGGRRVDTLGALPPRPDRNEHPR